MSAVRRDVERTDHSVIQFVPPFWALTEVTLTAHVPRPERLSWLTRPAPAVGSVGTKWAPKARRLGAAAST
jgi:hypothetical protein